MLYTYQNIPKNIEYNSDGDIINYIDLSQILSSIVNSEDIINQINYIRWDESPRELCIDFEGSLSMDAKIVLNDIIEEA